MIEDFLKKFKLRPVQEDDLEMLLEWRNQDCVRKYMYTSHIISPEEHKNWYDRNKGLDSTKLFIFEFEKAPFAFLNISEINKKNKTCSWAFYIGQNIQSVKALGYFMEIVALDKMVNELGIRKISCEVLEFNKAVIKMHKKFGFEEEGIFKKHISVEDGYVDVHRLAMFSENWETNRINILEDLAKITKLCI